MLILFILIGLFILWNLILSYAFFRMSMHYNKLTAGVTTRTLRESLEKILDAYVKNKKDISSLSQSLNIIDVDAQKHLQRIGIVRFNPFSDTGGSQSFTVALLDKKNDGVVMTSLYARTGNRWYIKYIQNGVGTDVELSREEKAAVQDAIEGKRNTS